MKRLLIAATALSLIAGTVEAQSVIVQNPVTQPVPGYTADPSSSQTGNGSQTAASTPTTIMPAVSGKVFHTRTGWCYNPNTTGVALTFSDAKTTPFYVPQGLKADIPLGTYLVSNGANTVLSFTLLATMSNPVTCALSGSYQ